MKDYEVIDEFTSVHLSDDMGVRCVRANWISKKFGSVRRDVIEITNDIAPSVRAVLSCEQALVLAAHLLNRFEFGIEVESGFLQLDYSSTSLQVSIKHLDDEMQPLVEEMPRIVLGTLIKAMVEAYLAVRGVR